MKVLNIQFMVLMGTVVLLATMTFADDNRTSAPFPSSQTDLQDDDDDEEDDWVFDAGPYSNNPKTGERVWQYAKEKPAYRDAPSHFSIVPRYSSNDPFFMPNTDSMFFLNTPDPFYAEPTGNPIFYNGTFGSNSYFYGIGSSMSEN